jgi:hypothetical protein
MYRRPGFAEPVLEWNVVDETEYAPLWGSRSDFSGARRGISNYCKVIPISQGAVNNSYL